VTYRFEAATSTWTVLCEGCETVVETGYYALHDAMTETADHTCED
jgi:hypothetical protein